MVFKTFRGKPKIRSKQNKMLHIQFLKYFLEDLSLILIRKKNPFLDADILI